MKKTLRMLAVLLVILGASTLSALPYEQDFYYYSDDTFQTLVGVYESYCDGTVFSSGNQGASWRVSDAYHCSSGLQAWHKCQESDGMGGWINVGCPPGV